MQDFKGKVAVVTGGNSGIGLGIARSLAAEGCNLVLVGMDQEKANRAAAELGTGNFASEIVYGILGAVEGETNPGCIDLIFHLWPKIIQGFSCPGIQNYH